jgi:two-component system cell cycle sensor histidine kinase/response regulator CckA
MSLLAEQVAPGSEAAELVQDLEQAGTRASQLTQQMLAYSGRGRFKIERLDLGQQVREITPLIRSSIAKNVELQLNVSDDLPLVEADAAQMQQVIMNLIINGAEAIGSSGGKVVVSTATEQIDQPFAESLSVDSIHPGRYVLLRVRDTGRGMDPDVKAKIFDPFFTTKFTGRGLGLAAVIGIVRGHKGAIRVESEPDKGATFSAYFPAVEWEAKAKDAAPPERTAVAGTVLIVDDEEVVLKVAKMSLERAGFAVLAAENGQRAVDLLATPGARVDLVLLDMTMPVMSGEEALRQLKKLRPDVPVVASSGYNEIEALQRFGQGIAGFIQKPYSAPELIAQIQKALRPAIG